jgi:hypothetical protein
MMDMVEAVGEWLESETKAFWQMDPFRGVYLGSVSPCSLQYRANAPGASLEKSNLAKS